MARQRIIPRGIRNNNPLNIRVGNVWLGEVPHPTDNAFEQFCTMEYGIRAAFIILRRYIRRYGNNTIRSIISTWAPETENKTETYITTVATAIGIDPDAPIDYADVDTMVKLVAAMAKVECGQPIPEEKIRKGYDMA